MNIMIFAIIFACMIVPILALIKEASVLFLTFRGTEYCADEKKEHRFQKKKRKYEWFIRFGWIIELVLYLLCIALEYVYLQLFKIVIWNAGVEKQLRSHERYQPINSGYISVVIMVFVIFLVGLIILYITDEKKISSILTASGIGALYTGCAYSFIWTIHISACFDNIFDVYMLILPVVTLMIVIRISWIKSRDYCVCQRENDLQKVKSIVDKILPKRNTMLYLPILGLYFAILIICIIMLVSLFIVKEPLAIIKVFTETRGYLFSIY